MGNVLPSNISRSFMLCSVAADWRLELSGPLHELRRGQTRTRGRMTGTPAACKLLQHCSGRPYLELVALLLMKTQPLYSALLRALRYCTSIYHAKREMIYQPAPHYCVVTNEKLRWFRPLAV